MDKICQNCGASNRSTANFCRVCRAPLPALPIFSDQAIVPVGKAGQMPAGSHAPAALYLSDGSSLPLELDTTIGRDETRCRLAFPDAARMSKLHARIYFDQINWIIQDTNSTNGTFVNGNRIMASMVLQVGDQVTVGDLSFVFNAPPGRAVAKPTQVGELPMPVSPPSPLNPYHPFITPADQQPAGGWRSWNRPPTAEGRVNTISQRYMMKKDDLVKRGFVAAALSLFVSPALIFLPFIQGNDIAAQDLRIEDHNGGHMIDVKILGDMMGNISQGDFVAVWGISKNGLIIMQTAHNYTNKMDISIKK